MTKNWYQIADSKVGRCKRCSGTSWIVNLIRFGCDYCGAK